MQVNDLIKRNLNHPNGRDGILRPPRQAREASPVAEPQRPTGGATTAKRRRRQQAPGRTARGRRRKHPRRRQTAAAAAPRRRRGRAQGRRRQHQRQPTGRSAPWRRRDAHQRRRRRRRRRRAGGRRAPRPRHQAEAKEKETATGRNDYVGRAHQLQTARGACPQPRPTWVLYVREAAPHHDLQAGRCECAYTEQRRRGQGPVRQGARQGHRTTWPSMHRPRRGTRQWSTHATVLRAPRKVHHRYARSARRGQRMARQRKGPQGGVCGQCP